MVVFAGQPGSSNVAPEPVSAKMPLAATCEVRRTPQPLPGVSPGLTVRSGNELTRVLTPDHVGLRDLAAPRRTRPSRCRASETDTGNARKWYII